MTIRDGRRVRYSDPKGWEESEVHDHKGWEKSDVQ